MKSHRFLAHIVKNGLQSILLLLAFNFTESSFSQGCPGLIFQYKAATNSFQRYGYGELTNASTPPKMYLTETIVDSRDYNDITDYSGSGSDGSVVETGHNINNYNLHVAYTKSAASGNVVSNVSGFCYADEEYYQYVYDPDFNPSLTYTNLYNGSAAYTGVWSDGGSLASAMLAGMLASYSGPVNGSIKQTAETFDFMTTSSNYLDGGDILLDLSGSHTITLGNENKDGELFANLNSTMPAYSGWGAGCGTAGSAYADSSCGNVTGVKMTYRIYLENWKPGKSYKVKWKETTTTSNFTSNVAATIAEKEQDVTPTGDQTQPYLVCTTEVLDPIIGYPTSSVAIGEEPETAQEIPTNPPGGGGPE